MREILLNSALAHAEGQIAKRKANIEVYLTNPAGIGEHSDIIEAIETELDQMSRYEEQIGILKKYFMKNYEGPGYSI